MTVFSSLFHRGLTPQQIFNTGQDGWINLTAAGISATVEQAMSAANGKCIRLLADDIAQLPLDFYRKVGNEQQPIDAPDWYMYPTTNRWDTWPDHITEVVVSLLSDGNAFIRGLPFIFAPEYLYVFDPTITQVEEKAGQVVITNAGKPYYDADVAHIKWVRMPGTMRGLNVLQAAKETTGLELAAREWAASFFANGATLSGYIKHPGTPTPDTVKNLQDAFAAKHVGRRKSHAFGILTGGAEFKELTINPQQAELGPLWQHVVEEAAALYHIPPYMIGSQVPSGQSYASVEQKSIEYVVHAVVPVVRRLEAAYSRLIPGDDTFVKFNVNALLRGDAWSRAQVHAAYLQNKVITRDEVRRLEDMEPADEAFGLGSENGGFLETPNNNNGSGDSPAAQAAPDAGPAQPQRMVDVHVTTPDVRVDTPDVTINMPEITVPTVPGIHVESFRIEPAAVAQIGDEMRAEVNDGTGRIEATINTVAAALSDDHQRAIAELRETIAEREARLAAEIAERDEKRLAAERAKATAERAPSTREVQRDEAGRIVAVVERSAGTTRKRLVDRDEKGRIISVTEVAA